ncbi:MAG: nodulation protein NfeD [Chloroflexi bacterium]|nr:nodulation protein NfeD [Chloroflexota bacterium]
MKLRRWTLARGFLLLLFSTVFLLGLVGQTLAQEGEKTAFVAEVDGIINPVSQRFITRTVEKGEKEGAHVVIILLDTPGGLLSSTRKIFESFLNAEVPTVVFVSPRGAQAASAGTFITAAANFAVMAPGTSIGAATPVGGGGQDLPDTLKDKVTNAAAADMRAIAAERGRNADELEKTVRQAKSFSAQEAVDLNVVDFIAQDLDDLLLKLDGMSATVAGQERVLDTQDITVRRLNMSLVDRFLFLIADPNISFILLSVGGLAIVIEVLNPGLIFPGLVGVIFLVLAFVSLGNLPVNWAGAALILFAGALIVAEFYVAGFGILGVGGFISFIIGALLLFSHFGSPSPTEPSIGVSLWVLIPFATAIVLSGAWVMFTIYQSRKPAPERSVSGLVGMTGVVVDELAPRGTIRLQGELWTGIVEGDDHVASGERVTVLAVEGVILTVERLEVAPKSEDNPSSPP